MTARQAKHSCQLLGSIHAPLFHLPISWLTEEHISCDRKGERTSTSACALTERRKPVTEAMCSARSLKGGCKRLVSLPARNQLGTTHVKLQLTSSEPAESQLDRDGWLSSVPNLPAVRLQQQLRPSCCCCTHRGASRCWTKKLHAQSRWTRWSTSLKLRLKIAS